MTTVTTVPRGRRGWLIAALAVASAVLLGSILAVGAWGLGSGELGAARTGSGTCVIDDHRGDHDGPMMGRDRRSGDAPDGRFGGMGTMGGWGQS